MRENEGSKKEKKEEKEKEKNATIIKIEFKKHTSIFLSEVTWRILPAILIKRFL
jgi:uncharacterized protein YqhQ